MIMFLYQICTIINYCYRGVEKILVRLAVSWLFFLPWPHLVIFVEE